MKKLAIFSVFCGVLAMLLGGFFAPPAVAVPGDVNGDGSVEFGDILYLIDYLFTGGSAPPNPIDADIDGSPGINMGDLLQLIGHFSGCELLPYTGVSVRVGSNIRFSSDLIRPMDPELGNTVDTTYIKIIENGGPDLMGMVIPISFANQPNEVEVILDSVSFSGSIIPWPDWAMASAIDNVNKTVLIYPYADDFNDPPLDSGTTGLVATLYFTKLVDGDPLAISTTEIPPSHSFILIKSYCADGISPSERIFTPKLSLNRNGDANCDGIIDLGDILYLVSYLYKGGPPPCGL
ncbi:MAG: hypothetical protein AMJ91_07705 [candidate division Zixibacteria bacterium SM23_73_3]|nr:MAG: hypothetical protein AMJ91_07705 [candidate division Zixibacteria bacterium SM23_73_3]